jgi:hypothetical protein
MSEMLWVDKIAVLLAFATTTALVVSFLSDLIRWFRRRRSQSE